MSYISDKDSAPLSLFGVNGGNTSTDAALSTLVGAKFGTNDGREFVLVQNGGTALVSGVLVQSPASIGANHTGLAVTGAATVNVIGSTTVTVTMEGTLATANQYAGGYAVVSAGLGIGQTLKIASHPSATSSGTCVLTLEDPLSVALDTTSKISLTLPQYGSQNGTDVTTSGVIVCPTTLTGRVIGVTLYPIPASTSTVPTYGFIVTKGAVSCLNGGGTAIGLDVMPSGATPGAVVTYVVATKTRVGTATVAGEDTKSQLITLQL
jgi:hypothetical protein